MPEGLLTGSPYPLLSIPISPVRAENARKQPWHPALFLGRQLVLHPMLLVCRLSRRRRAPVPARSPVFTPEALRADCAMWSRVSPSSDGCEFVDQLGLQLVTRRQPAILQL